MLLLSSSRINFHSVSLDLQLVIKDISELPKCAKVWLLERRGGGLSLWRTSVSLLEMSSEQWRQWQCTVVFRASENCPTSGRSNTSNLWITPVQMNKSNKWINGISAIVWSKKHKQNSIYHRSKSHQIFSPSMERSMCSGFFVFFPLEVFWDDRGSLAVANYLSFSTCSNLIVCICFEHLYVQSCCFVLTGTILTFCCPYPLGTCTWVFICCISEHVILYATLQHFCSKLDSSSALQFRRSTVQKNVDPHLADWIHSECVTWFVLQEFPVCIVWYLFPLYVV